MIFSYLITKLASFVTAIYPTFLKISSKSFGWIMFLGFFSVVLFNKIILFFQKITQLQAKIFFLKNLYLKYLSNENYKLI